MICTARRPTRAGPGSAFPSVLRALDSWRQELGLSPAAFAARLGLSEAQWGAIAHTRQALTLPVLRRILQVRPDLAPAVMGELLGCAEGDTGGRPAAGEVGQTVKPPSRSPRAASIRGAPLPGLRAARYRRGLSQLELARWAGVEPKTVYLLETRAQAARPGTVRKLATALRMAPDDLLFPASARPGDGLSTPAGELAAHRVNQAARIRG